MLVNVAKLLRKEASELDDNNDDKLPWPPSLEDLSVETYELPKSHE